MNDSPDSDLLDCTLPEENLSPINSNSISDHEVKEVTKCQQRYFSLLVDLWGAGEKLQGPTENSTRHTHSPKPNIYIYIYIYAFSRRFYPKRLTLHSSYSFYILSALAFPDV